MDNEVLQDTSLEVEAQTQKLVKLERGDGEVAQVADNEEINTEARLPKSPASLGIYTQEFGESNTPGLINNHQRPLFSEVNSLYSLLHHFNPTLYNISPRSLLLLGSNEGFSELIDL